MSSRGVWPYAFVAAVAIVAHAFVWKAALLLLNSDFSILSMLAQDFLRGEFWIMPPAQHFGGMTLTVVRALWLALCALLPGKTIHDPTTSLVFTYLLLPAAVATLGYAVASALFAPRAALAVGLLYALGFAGWIQMYGNDFYWGAMLLGLVALAWRARADDPWRDFDGLRMGIAGFVVGLSAYTWRGGLPLTVTLLLPMDREGWLSLRSNLRKARFALWGALIGFLPELVYGLKYNVPSGISGHGDWSTARDVGRNLARLPLAFREIVAGSEIDWSRSLSMLSVPLFLAAIPAFLWIAARRRAKLRPPAAVVILGLGSYLAVSTYAAGAWRYLLPFSMVLPLSLGPWFERALDAREPRRMAWAGALAPLLLLHFANQVSFRAMLRDEEARTGRSSVIHAVIGRFHALGVRAVACSDYWNCNTFTFASGREIRFVPPGRHHAPQEGYALLATEPRIGILVAPGTGRRYAAGDAYVWQNIEGRYDSTVGNLALFVSERASGR